MAKTNSLHIIASNVAVAMQIRWRLCLIVALGWMAKTNSLHIIASNVAVATRCRSDGDYVCLIVALGWMAKTSD